MTAADGPVLGDIAWRDLTVPDAERIRDFYADVVGWKCEPLDMDGYQDFCMIPPGGTEPVAGICHARGTNANLPPQWLLYMVVADVESSASRATELGGTILDGPREMGGGTMAVLRDPAGAVCAIWQPAPK